MRILFWGTPDFATPPLRALLGEGFDVVGVVTQPDRPQGRSRTTLVPSPVKVIAQEEGIRVLQPDRPRGDEWMAAMQELQPDLSVVVAYGHILPKAVIDLPSQGTLNIHASLLPLLRGAAPIQAAIRQGLRETGISIMRMVPALDAGPVIHQVAVPILPDETYGELQLRLAELGASALVEALAMLSVGASREQPQDDAQATYASKIEREDARIDWTLPAVDVCRTIRAFDPRPGAFSTLREQDVKLYGARLATDWQGVHGLPGDVLAIGDDGMLIACAPGSGAVRISLVHPSGKRRLGPREWMAGRGIAVGDSLGT